MDERIKITTRKMKDGSYRSEVRVNGDFYASIRSNDRPTKGENMKNTVAPTHHRYTFKEKRAALIDLVREAVDEQEECRFGPKSALAGSAFDAVDFQTICLDALVDALSRTDALSVLGRIFDEELK